MQIELPTRAMVTQMIAPTLFMTFVLYFEELTNFADPYNDRLWPNHDRELCSSLAISGTFAPDCRYDPLLLERNYAAHAFNAQARGHPYHCRV
jgi:hypothetical protein